MVHNTRRKEIIFMEKIRRIRLCILLVMTAAVMAACGRKNGNSMTTAPDAGNAGAGTSMESQTNGMNQTTQGTNAESGSTGESGGVLRDMVDDVGDGIDNLTDDVTGMSGTTAAGTAAGTEGTARETTQPD